MNNVEKEVLAAEAPVKDEMLDIPSHFRPVAEKYGRELFQLVMMVGVANQAVRELQEFAAKHQSRKGGNALRVLARCLGDMANSYAASQEWTGELFAQVDRDIGLAHAGRIEVVGSRIILDA